MSINKPKVTDFSHEIFGGVLLYDGAGYYPGLEILNLLFLNNEDDFLPSSEGISFNRKSMEFARKLVWDEEFETHPEKDNILYDDLTKVTIAKLLECLQLDIPNAAGRPAWHRAHFFPYTKNLIHYDARKRKQSLDPHNVDVERKYLRGAGALAFKVLRFDKNSERKKDTIEKLSVLFDGTYGGPLDQLADVLQNASKPQAKPYVDEIEKEKSTVFDDDTDELLRDGFNNIVSHTKLSPVKRVKAIVNWVAIWLLILQARRAAQYLTDETLVAAPFIMDIANKNIQLRRAARGSFDNVQKAIENALDLSVLHYNNNLEEQNNYSITKKNRNDLKGFFASTAAIIGLLNSNKGRRHFTLKVDALETLVIAGVPQGRKLPFDQFLNNWLGSRCNLLIGKKMAEKNNLLNRFDGAIFDDNETKLSDHLLAAGLLTQYSDATRMVGVYDDA